MVGVPRMENLHLRKDGEFLGRGAVDAVRTDLSSNKGWTHLGDEMSVRNSSGQLRRYDLVFRKPDGTQLSE